MEIIYKYIEYRVVHFIYLDKEKEVTSLRVVLMSGMAKNAVKTRIEADGT